MGRGSARLTALRRGGLLDGLGVGRGSLAQQLPGGEAPAKEAGKMRLEGKDYVVKDGDVMHFRFNV